MVRASFNASYVHLIPCPLHCFPLHNYRTILSTFLRILVHSHLVYVGTTPYSVQPIGPYSIALTIASSGPFRIYRAPGSVAFLSCGSALQPILPKSQCWCLDEDSSRFVLQIRRPQYWRIELPVDEADDIQRALMLRNVFERILLFEKTECPFQRSFTVELPEGPETPVRKKPWTPDGKNLISSPFGPLSSP